MVGEWSYCSVFTRYYNHQNRCLQHNSALQRLSHCGLSAQPSGHFCVTHSQSCSNDDEPAAGHACTLRAQQCARRGRSPHLVQRRHRTPGRDAHARTERLDINKSQRSTVNRVVIFSAGWNGRHVVPTHPSYWTPPLDPPSRRGGLDLRLLETSNRPTNDVEFP